MQLGIIPTRSHSHCVRTVLLPQLKFEYTPQRRHRFRYACVILINIMSRFVQILSAVACSLVLQSTAADAATSDCPCANVSLCNPITAGPRNELLVFSNPAHDPNGTMWPLFNWSLVTTVAVFEQPSDALYCQAHSANARVVRGWDLDNSQLTNATYIAEWVNSTAAMVAASRFDGINLDIEGNSANAAALTQAVALLRAALLADNPYAQLTFDTAIYPAGQVSGYDYKGLAEYCDFLIPMAYDMCWGASRAEANTPLPGVAKGLLQYDALGVPANKLVLGLPWYGYAFPCTNAPPPAGQPGPPICTLPPSWKDAGSWQVCYGYIVDTALPLAPGGTYSIDNATTSAWFSYPDPHNATAWRLMYYDNPATLVPKYAAAKDAGMWYGECLDYTSPQQVQSMWEAIYTGFFA